jgi:hypothetical protein
MSDLDGISSDGAQQGPARTEDDHAAGTEPAEPGAATVRDETPRRQPDRDRHWDRLREWEATRPSVRRVGLRSGPVAGAATTLIGFGTAAAALWCAQATAPGTTRAVLPEAWLGDPEVGTPALRGALITTAIPVFLLLTLMRLGLGKACARNRYGPRWTLHTVTFARVLVVAEAIALWVLAPRVTDPRVADWTPFETDAGSWQGFLVGWSPWIVLVLDLVAMTMGSVERALARAAAGSASRW